MKYLFIVYCLLLGTIVSAQVKLTNPVSSIKKSVTPSPKAFSTTPPKITTLNTFKINVSIPGYYYSNGKQQSAVVGMGYAFEHYRNDSLLYSVGPYIWYNTPIPTGSTKLPIGYGLAAGYKGLFLVGFLTPDLIHFGPVLSTNFSFGNGGIQFGGFTL